jgi:hypothetical protein
MSKNLYEILETICGNKTPLTPTVVECLQKESGNYALKEILRLNFDPAFGGFDLPEGAPPYKTDTKQPYGYAETNISANIRKLYIYMNSFEKIDRKRKEMMFQSVLESLHFREAELLIAVKDRNLTSLFPAITAASVREAFPDMLPPLAEDDLIDAAIVIQSHLDQGMIDWKQYTKDELIKLSVNKRIRFKFPEHAEKLGILHLADDFEEPEPVYDPEFYLSFTVAKTVFGNTNETKYHMPLVAVDVEAIKKLKTASHITFDDLEQAKQFGVDHLDVRSIIAAKEAARLAKLAPNQDGTKKRGRPAKAASK